jgi:hypothetical protein
MGAVYSSLTRSSLWARASDWQRLMMVWMLARVVAWWVPNLALLAVARCNVFLRYKIQADAAPSAALVWEALRENVLKDVAGFPLLAYPIYRLLTLGRTSEAPHSTTSGDSGSNGGDRASGANENGQECIVSSSAKLKPSLPLGWSGLQFDDASQPSALTTAWQVCSRRSYSPCLRSG